MTLYICPSSSNCMSRSHLHRKKLIMGKFLAWFFGTATLYAFCTSGIGLLIFVAAVIGFLGSAVGQNHTLTTTYIITAMTASYLLPIAVALYHQRFRWLIIIPLITSVVFAIPSSFVTSAGCKTGNESAIWAMKAIPVMWMGESAFATDKDNLTCTHWVGGQ